MPAIAIPALGLRLPAFWDRVRAVDPAVFAADYPAPFLLQLASLRDDEMLPEARTGRDAGPTIAATTGMRSLPLLPWAETRLVNLTKRTDAFPGQITIGRSENNDVVVPSALVSKRHAMVEQRDEQWFVTDVGSRNGTTVAGEPVRAMTPVLLEFGTEIGLGDTRWLFVLPFFFHHAVRTLLPGDAAK